MQALVIEWVLARLVKVVGVTVGLSVLVGSCVMRDHKQQAKGAQKAVAKIEKATDNASKLGTSAARKSAAPGVRGPVDPTTRND